MKHAGLVACTVHTAGGQLINSIIEAESTQTSAPSNLMTEQSASPDYLTTY